MRQLLVLVLACVPLAALTSWSFWQALAGDAPVTRQDDPPAIAEIGKRAAEALAEAKAKQPIATDLSRASWLDDEPPGVGKLDEKWNQAWTASRQAHHLLSKYARIGATSVPADAPPGSRRREAEAALARLKGFIEAEKQNFAGQVPGADDFFTMLAGRERELEKEIERYRESDRVAEAVAAVKNDLDQGRYDAMLKRLDTDPLDHVADADLAGELQLLRKRGEYRQRWDELDRSGASTADADLLKAMQAFLRRFPDPPSPAERDLQAQLERRRDRLRSEISVHVLDQAGDLDTLLVEAARIAANGQIDEPIKQKARDQVSAWLARRLPKIEAPSSLLGKEEAVTKSGQRKIGIFFLPPGVDNYRFWSDRKNREKLRQGEEQIAKSALEQPPAPPQYVTWAEAYSQAVAKVLLKRATRQEWQEFTDDCDTWQRALSDYRQRWGIEDEPDRSCREWSFRDANLIGQSVLRLWNEYQEIVGATSAASQPR